MKQILTITILAIFLSFSQPVPAAPIEGQVSTEGKGLSSRIIDKTTGAGVSGAQVTLPKQRYTTKTDSDGYFELDTYIDGTSIMSVQKENYKPYSVTVTDQT